MSIWGKTAICVLFLLSAAVPCWAQPENTGESAADAVYTVCVNGEPVTVYTAQTEHFEGDYYFASFDVSSAATVEITSALALGTAALSAEQNARLFARSEHSAAVAVTGPGQFSFEPNGSIKPLLLFADAPETDIPSSDDPNVIYFGPGYHKAGKIALESNQTLYLAKGAVVSGGVDARGDNITICGRGILAGEEYPRFTGPTSMHIAATGCRHLTVRDITMRNTWSWALVPWNCEDVTIDNVKICGSRMINDDALDLVNVKNAVVTNCFFRSQDDCVAIKGGSEGGNPTENLRIENCRFWTDSANIFRIGYESVTPIMQNISADNIHVLHYAPYRDPKDYWSHAVVFLQPSQNMPMENLRFENFRIDSDGRNMNLLVARPMSCSYGNYQDPEPGHLRDVLLKNFDVTGVQGDFTGTISIEGVDEEHRSERVRLENIRYFGRPVTAESPNVSIGPFADDCGIAAF